LLEYLSPLSISMRIRYEVLGEEGLDLIEPLWLELRQMHRARSVHFRNVLGAKTYGQRRDELLEKAGWGLIRVELARDDEGRPLGYCVSTIDSLMTGEVDSLYVTSMARGLGIGTRLMEGALAWMDAMGVNRKVLTAIVGNEEVHSFYARFGFLPKCVLLERVPDTGGKSGPDKPI